MRIPYMHVAALSRPWWKVWERYQETWIVFDHDFTWTSYSLKNSRGVDVALFPDDQNKLLPSEIVEVVVFPVPIPLMRGHKMRLRAFFPWWPGIHGAAVALHGYKLED
jgi:hypothetical protein